jgi:DNA-binding beta-propeller fold protein YncE
MRSTAEGSKEKKAKSDFSMYVNGWLSGKGRYPRSAHLVRESPIDLGYSVVEGWPKIPKQWKLGLVGGVACSPDRYYVSQRDFSSAPPVLCFDREGEFINAIGEGTDIWPHMVKCDKENNVWIIDTRNHILYLYSPDGELLKSLGTKGVPGEDGSHFRRPTDIAFSPDGRIYVSDGYDNRRIAIFDKDLSFLGQFGSEGVGEGQFIEPHSLTIDKDGLIYVADRENRRIEIFTRQCQFITQWRHIGYPEGITYAPDGFIYVCDGDNFRISKVDLEGNVVAFLGEAELGFWALTLVHDIEVNEKGDILAALLEGGVKLLTRT